ncbi:hypothetical protein SLS60_006301 [Paraconiothyrium brasiliense]|uniref:Uncharacterized protein n=1 Tax=Paraconiothyrium brasiliense TaxID=300254 RepID=A0ABR3RAA7_9PLEO
MASEADVRPFRRDIDAAVSIWLLDLAKQVPKDAQLDGFDISSAHFPPKNELPGNVSLNLLDMMQPIPEHHVGRYDIVHIARIVLYIQKDDPSKLLNQFISLLNNIFRSHDLEVVDFQRKTVGDSMARPWTLMQLMANRDFIENDIVPMCDAGKMPPGSPSADEWREMSKNLILECQNGVKLITDIVYIVARKPTGVN